MPGKVTKDQAEISKQLRDMAWLSGSVAVFFFEQNYRVVKGGGPRGGGSLIFPRNP